MIDGGISRPSVPAPESVPITRSSGYLRDRNSGIDILPTVATVAADDPEIAAKMVQPMMFVWSSRPGSRFIQGASPLNRSSDRRVRNRISPIQMNSGRAVSVQLAELDQITVIMRSPIWPKVPGANSTMPVKATPISEKPTQTPLPNRNSRTARNTTVA